MTLQVRGPGQADRVQGGGQRRRQREAHSGVEGRNWEVMDVLFLRQTLVVDKFLSILDRLRDLLKAEGIEVEEGKKHNQVTYVFSNMNRKEMTNSLYTLYTYKWNFQSYKKHPYWYFTLNILDALGG